MTVVYCVGKLNSHFLFWDSELFILSPENLICTAWNTGQKKIRNIAPKFVQNTFGHFWKRLKAFFEFRNFFVFFENFRRLDLPWNTGQKNFFKKITPKHVQNTFEHFWERFWVFMEFWSFLIFFWNLSKIRHSVEQWEKTFFSKKAPKDVWTLGNDLDNLRTLKFFDFFLEFFLCIYLKF